jgi:hypothetical protein
MDVTITGPVGSERGTRRIFMLRRNYKCAGVPKGAYHVVFRRGLAQGPFRGMVHFLTRDLATIEESAVPDPSPGERAQRDE